MPENATKPVVVELGIEFLVEMLLFLYPYGADQMGLPHNFYLGLTCWIIGTAIAIRMFWICPLWSKRLSNRKKMIIVVAFLILFIAVFYRPVNAAYHKRNENNEQAQGKLDTVQTSSPTSNQQQQSSLMPSPKQSVPAETNNKQKLSKPPMPQQDNSVHVDNGSKIDQQSTGLCSPNIVGGSNTINCPPAPKDNGIPERWKIAGNRFSELPTPELLANTRVIANTIITAKAGLNDKLNDQFRKYISTVNSAGVTEERGKQIKAEYDVNVAILRGDCASTYVSQYRPDGILLLKAMERRAPPGAIEGWRIKGYEYGAINPLIEMDELATDLEKLAKTIESGKPELPKSNLVPGWN